MTEKQNIIAEKSYNFAIRIVHLYEVLNERSRVYVISKQILRCGTSIGANVREALRGQSNADFGAKMNIALKEASETEYWLNLLHDTDYLKDNEYESIIADCQEVIRLLTSIVKTTFSKNK